MVVVLGASSSEEDDEEESDEDEVDAALLLRFLFLFLCVGGGFVTAGGILREMESFTTTLERNYVIGETHAQINLCGCRLISNC